jgi:hypothetical protein
MKTRQILPLCWLVTILAVLLASCGSSEKTLTGADQEAVLAFSEAMTDNLLAGLNNNDYTAFSRDFDQDMLAAMSAAKFADLKADRDVKVGQYLSREVASVVQTGDFYVVIYTAAFDKEAQVTMRVVFRVAEPHNISGLWFNK